MRDVLDLCNEWFEKEVVLAGQIRITGVGGVGGSGRERERERERERMKCSVQ